MKLADLTRFLDEELHLEQYRSDHSNNGLQVEGDPEVRRAAFAVSGRLKRRWSFSSSITD